MKTNTKIVIGSLATLGIGYVGYRLLTKDTTDKFTGVKDDNGKIICRSRNQSNGQLPEDRIQNSIRNTPNIVYPVHVYFRGDIIRSISQM